MHTEVGFSPEGIVLSLHLFSAPGHRSVEQCSCLSPSRLCSCSYHSCELCLLGCYQSSVPTHSAEFRDNLFFPAWLFAAFLSLGAPPKSFQTEVCDSLSPSASFQLFAVSFLSSSLTILPTQQACFGLIFSLPLACFNLPLPWGPQASAYC